MTQADSAGWLLPVLTETPEMAEHYDAAESIYNRKITIKKKETYASVIKNIDFLY